MIPMCSKLYTILLQCMCTKRNVLLSSSSLCMLARCFRVVSASIATINLLSLPFS